MELLSIIGGKIADYAIEPVVRQVGYVINLKSNVENLRTQLDNLVEVKDSVQYSLDEALRKGHKIKAHVEKWQRRVDGIIAEADEFLNDHENQVKKKCLFGFCPSLISSYYQLSRKATKLAQKVVVEIQKGEFTSVSYTTPPKDTWTTAGYQAFDSRISIVTQIMEELTDINIHMIGIYGLSGVGKTTLVKEIARQATEKKLFDNVAKVEVRQNTDLKRIQKEIAEKFGLELDENQSIVVRGLRLREYIENKKKILVILDDIWEKLDLETLGIPSGVCTILLTSRTREVLSSEMDREQIFCLEVLKEEETWSLFESIVGEDAVKDPDIRSVAIEVAKICGGLPVLVGTVAKALRGKSLHSWKDALRRLKMCDGKGMLEKAYSGIEWSYDQLEDEAKSLFLVFRMIGGRTIFLNYLLKCTVGLGLGLYEGVNTMKEADDRLRSLVDVLKDSCLLLHVNGNEIFTMHDLVRDVAMSIASRDQQFLSLAYGEEFKEWPNKEFLQKCALISIYRVRNIPNFPEKFECPKLQFFQMCDKNKSSLESLQIPNNFFKETKELKVLDLTRFRFPTLPPSIHFLENLQTLCLDQCELGDIAILGKLRSLEILSFLDSRLKQIPKEIGQLTKLRLLDLSWCSGLEVIHPNVISSLTRLEELKMNNNFNKWEIEEVNNISERSNASLTELKNLANLIALDINIENSNQLPINCFSKKLVSFMISIGDDWKWSAKYPTSKMLKLKLSQTNQLDQGLQTLMKKSEDLYLDVLELDQALSQQLDMDGFQRLKYLHVQNNPEILHIVKSCGSVHNAFPVLKELFLYNLVGLESLCSGQPPLGSFRQLTTIKVEKCPKLKNLFSSCMVPHFLQLQEIEVVDCNNMKEIVGEEKEENFEAQVNDDIEFCQLRILKLQNLPELTCFASNNEIDSPMGLFNHKLSARLSSIENLVSLIVDGCDGFTLLSSSSMAIKFVQLKKLQISRCKNMVEIISTEEEKMDNMFPKLESLELNSLANLETFCSSATYLKFSCLNFLDIKGCTKLGPFILGRMSKNITDAAVYYLFDEKVGFPNLEKLVIEGLHKLRTIWHTQLDPNSFGKLTEIQVDCCPSLIHILVPSILQRLNRTLKVLRIKNCDSLEAVFNVEETRDTLLASGQLEIFSCRNLCDVEISKCRSLKNVFPASVARNRNLEKLQRLWIYRCEILEQIVGEEVGVEEAMPKFVFPSAEEVCLSNLPQLSSFYPGKHTSKWPALIDLTVNGCDKLVMVAAESSCFQEQHEMGIPTYKQVFFLYEKGSFSNLKILGLGIKETLYGSFPVDFFKIEYLGIHCKYITSAVSLSVFLQKCHNLQKLDMVGGDNEEIFIHEGSLDGEQHLVGTLTHLKFLRILRLDNLMHAWKDNSHLAGPVFLNLETLKVEFCKRLKNIVSSAISYRNIVKLEVSNCAGMKHLITYSVAKSLINLEKMTVGNCERMTEIVASDDDHGDIDVENEITFSRLQCLKLSNLPNLKGFCSRNYNVRFPFFITLSVNGCMEMKTSLDGVLLDDSKRERVPIIEDDDDDDDLYDDNADKDNAVDEAL